MWSRPGSRQGVEEDGAVCQLDTVALEMRQCGDVHLNPGPRQVGWGEPAHRPCGEGGVEPSWTVELALGWLRVVRGDAVTGSDGGVSPGVWEELPVYQCTWRRELLCGGQGEPGTWRRAGPPHAKAGAPAGSSSLPVATWR